ncbi:DUF5518 domain-containing protein [Methanobacterium alcaliphilum]|uniref:DUF5518 domain-containing protein n=1 Tax=Methanobacterium alcaliphilum TaxID=392018 RepID=UPI00200B7768|nr:DUF5518 domain-containing protein [Methanobacterium alcaliphilum]MCK9151726.1 DUF5518 domain-containing protein [Methanobacterium alcaliphilum]
MKEMIQKRPVILGIAIIIVLYLVSLVSGQSLLFPSFLMTGIIVGFMVGGSYKHGAINGTIFGIKSALIVTLLMILILYLQGAAAYLGLIASTILLYFIVEVVVSVVGGVIGSLIRSEVELDRDYSEDEE